MAPRVFFLLVAVLLPQLGWGDSSPPDSSQIRQWWNSGKEWQKVERIVPITLAGKETAFLASVFLGRGRNLAWGTLLIRPKLKKAREIEGIVSEFEIQFEVHDLNNDSVTEIAIQTVGSGQGTTSGTRSILYFDGWDSVILHEKDFGDNLGGCGKDTIEQWCRAEEVKWSYVDLDGDSQLDLIETIIIKRGLDPERLKLTIQVNKFLFKNKIFVPVSPRNLSRVSQRIFALCVGPVV